MDSNYKRRVAVTYRRGTSAARSLKLLALPYPFLQSNRIYNIILATSCSYVISPCVTNKCLESKNK